jgi:uncharacterized protein YkwD
LGLLVAVFAPLAAVARALSAHLPREPCRGADLHPTPGDIAEVQAATMCLINQTRLENGRRALRGNRSLQRVGRAQVAGMLHWNYFADVRPSGQTARGLIDSTRYGAHAARLRIGQNIGWGTGPEASPRGMVAAWMRSPPHRALLLGGAFSDMGVGVAPALPAALHAGGGALYAVEFAARRAR